MNIAEFYNDRAKQYKEGWKASHWVSKESQNDNFNLLTMIAPFEPTDRILDLGCGQGDLLSFMNKRGWVNQYEGIDCSETQIERAWQRHPKGRFACIDFLDDKFNYKYDWIIASGPFNHVVEGDQYEYLRKCFKKMYSLAAKGFAVTLTSKYDPMNKINPSPYLFSYDPLTVLKDCYDLTYLVNMNHTALSWGILIFVYNEPWFLS